MPVTESQLLRAMGHPVVTAGEADNAEEQNGHFLRQLQRRFNEAPVDAR